MTTENCIKLGGRLGAIASQVARRIAFPVSAGIALATGCWGLATTSALAAATMATIHDSQSPAEQHHAVSAQSPAEQHHAVSTSQPQAWRAFGLGSHPPPQLAIRKAKPTNPSHKLRIHNLCSKTVEIVVRYQDPQLNWWTQGGGGIPGKTSRYFTSSSQPLGLSNKVLYYYATSPDSDLVWSGSGSHQYHFEGKILNMRIHYAALDVLEDYSLFILCAAETP